MFTNVRNRIEREYSAQNAHALTAAIHGYDRWSTFAQYHRTGVYCATRMREYGLEDVELMEVPADGVSRIGDWTMPLAWDVEDATLRVAEADGGGRILAHYREEPATLAIWSAPTPPGGVEAEVVFIPEGLKEEDYEQLDLKGKVVFTHQSHAQVRGPAARHGAIGFITDWPACKEDALADAVCWMNSWVDHHGWGFTKRDTPIWGFSLTREKGQYLERLLSGGKALRVHAVVASCLYEGSFVIPTGVLRGESDQEVLVYAHSCEYGAEDNATGCATVLEAARTLAQLIREGQLPRPRRSIRFMMSWECYGSIPWAVQRLCGRNHGVVAGLCLDAFAGKRQITGGHANLVLNPHCQASYTDYLVGELARACLGTENGLGYELVPWYGGTDHTIFEDPFFNVPMPWLTEHPSRFHHTSLDEMDKIDRVSLGAEGVFATTYLYFLANASEADCEWLARGAQSDWRGRLEKATAEALAGLAAQGNAAELGRAWQNAQERLAYLIERGMEAIRSVARLSGSEPLAGTIREEVKELEREGRSQVDEIQKAARAQALGKGWEIVLPQERRQAKAGQELIPRRLVPGLLTLCAIPPEERAEYQRVTHGESPMWSSVLTFGLFWADGKRPIGEIQRLVELELGPTAIDLVEYFRFLQRLGYIAWA